MRRQTVPSGGWNAWTQFGGPAGCVPALGNTAGGALVTVALGPAGSWVAARHQVSADAWSDWERIGDAAAGIPCGYV
jgi:hypothetical protein